MTDTQTPQTLKLFVVQWFYVSNFGRPVLVEAETAEEATKYYPTLYSMEKSHFIVTEVADATKVNLLGNPEKAKEWALVNEDGNYEVWGKTTVPGSGGLNRVTRTVTA
jgi:hypothetical protein